MCSEIVIDEIINTTVDNERIFNLLRCWQLVR